MVPPVGGDDLTAEWLRLYLRAFVKASVARAHAELGFRPAVRIAVDALEAVALGGLDELFARLNTAKGTHMWWQLLAPVLADIFRQLLDRLFPPVFGAPAAAPAADDGEVCDQFIVRLQHVQQEAARAMRAGTVGHDGGVIQHVTELITALQDRDWRAVGKCLTDILGHL
jgi:hypothetical protein